MMVKQKCLVLLALITLAAPASAQWNRVLEVPDDAVHSVWTRGDTIAAGLSNRIAVSFDAGVTWSTSTPVAPGVTAVNAARAHQGRLFAGTDGHGVFVSSDRGATWQSFNQGLVGGFANAQLFIVDLLLRADTLYAATLGAGPWIRNLASGAGWSRYGDIFEPDQATNMQALAALALTFNMAALSNTLYAGRLDGLWRRAIDTVAVPPGPAPRDLRFAIAGSNPIRDEARFRFELPEPGRVRIDLFDISGRRAAGGVDEVLPAGAHERQLQARNLAPGMYLARLSAGNRSAVLRLVRTR